MQNQECLKPIYLLWKKKNPSKVIQSIEPKNRHSPFETKENPTDNGNRGTDSVNKEVSAKQNAINPFVSNALFLYLLNTSENRKVFWCFQGYRKGALETNGSKAEYINAATQSIKNSNHTPDKRKLPVTVILDDSTVKDIKDWKMPRRTRKVVVKHFRGAKN